MIIPRPRELSVLGGSVAFHPDLVQLAPEEEALGPEGYRLDVDASGIRLTPGGRAGRFYGLQTLAQFGAAVPYGTIEDTPRFGWRGVMLDVARHFMPKAFVLRLIDLLAEHKLNILHLHLTDDQGWRLEIERYPRLTEVGARRGGSAEPDGERNYYTREDIREMVAYAAERFVTIVPEIEMPGHAQAAIAAYPELGNDPSRRLEVWSDWGISEHVLNLEESTIQFCKDVLDEVVDLFPGTHIHVGGDECPPTEWERSPRARERLAELGLAGPSEACGWFIGRMAEHLASHGRTLIAWDEPDRRLTPGTTAMVWHDEHAGGDRPDIILAPHTRTYLDYYPSDAPGQPPAQPGVVTLADAYGFVPDPWARGVQCQIWTEYMSTPEQVEYMAFPRLCAFAEVGWGSPEDYPDFLLRLDQHLARLTAQGVRVGPLVP